MTYGSPLQRLYAPWFPAFFDVATFEELGNRLPQRWDKHYRTTDPIGGSIPPGPPVGPVDVMITPTDTIAAGDFVYPEIRAHSDYPLEPEYDGRDQPPRSPTPNRSASLTTTGVRIRSAHGDEMFRVRAPGTRGPQANHFA